MKALICMQHVASPEQVAELSAAGVSPAYLRDENPALFAKLAQCVPNVLNLAGEFADQIGKWAGPIILPIGSPGLQMALGFQLDSAELDRVFFAHTRRESVDEPQSDGSVKKVTLFRHEGFFTVSGLALADWEA